MERKYADYTDDEGIRRFHEIARGFDLGPVLGTFDFPDAFVKAYQNQFLDDEDRTEFVAVFSFGKQQLMLNTIFTPDYIYSQNRILGGADHPSETNRLPPNHVVIGDAYGDTGNPFLLVNLNETSTQYGKIYAWYLPGDLLGDDDGPQGLGYVANDLQTFIENLARPRDLL